MIALWFFRGVWTPSLPLDPRMSIHHNWLNQTAAWVEAVDQSFLEHADRYHHCFKWVGVYCLISSHIQHFWFSRRSGPLPPLPSGFAHVTCFYGCLCFSKDISSTYTEQKWKSYTTIFYFCDEVLDKKYLLKLNNVSQTSSKRFVETASICLFWCLNDVPFCVLSFINWILQLRMAGHVCMQEKELGWEQSPAGRRRRLVNAIDYNCLFLIIQKVLYPF